MFVPSSHSQVKCQNFEVRWHIAVMKKSFITITSVSFFCIAALLTLCIIFISGLLPASYTNTIQAIQPQHVQSYTNQFIQMQNFESRSPKKWTNKCGVIWFHHIQKTGGVNLNHVLISKIKELNGLHFQFLGKSNYSKGTNDPFNNELIPFLKTNLNKKNGSNILYVHQHNNSPSWHQMVKEKKLKYVKDIVEKENCDTLFVTMLREPFRHCLSYFSQKGIYNETIIISRLNTRHYGGTQIGYVYMGNMPQNRTLIFENTVKLLNQFDIIGFTEEYNKFLQQIFEITGIPFTENEFNKTLYQKKRNARRKHTNLSNELLQTIIETHQLDFKLYYYFRNAMEWMLE